MISLEFYMSTRTLLGATNFTPYRMIDAQYDQAHQKANTLRDGGRPFYFKTFVTNFYESKKYHT